MTATFDYFPHNWAASCRVETSYRTEVLASRDEGREERRGYSERPYRAISVRWTGLSGAEQSRLLYALWRAAGQRTYVPIYPDQQLTTAASSSTTLHVPTTDSRFAVGAEVLVIAPNGTQERRTVSSFTTSAITLGTALSTTYPTRSRVYPLVLAEVLPESSHSATTTSIGEVEATFLEVFSSSSLPAAAAPSAPGVLGATTSAANPDAPSSTPVLALSPNFVSPVTTSIARPFDKVDQGLTTLYSLHGERAAFGFDFRYSTRTKAAAGDLLRFFDSRKGRLLPFWFVHPALQWTLSSIATTHVDVVAAGNVADLQDSLEYVAVVMKDGTVYIRKVSSVGASGGAFVITLASSLPSLSGTNVARVTSAHFCRFAKDALAQDATTDTSSDWQLSIVEVLAEAPATEIDLPDPVLVDADCEVVEGCVVGQWSVCFVAYYMDPGSIGGDCNHCLMSFEFHHYTVSDVDSCLIHIPQIQLAAGHFDSGTGELAGGPDSCVGLHTAGFDLLLTNTHGEYWLVATVAASVGANVAHVYASMSSGPPTASGTQASCASPGAFVPDDRIPFGAACSDITIPNDWFIE
jgi:hypothetical protein